MFKKFRDYIGDDNLKFFVIVATGVVIIKVAANVADALTRPSN